MDGSLLRSRPYRIAHLAEDQVQALLRYAIGEGGLGEACDEYYAQVDNDSYPVITIHAGGLDKQINVAGPSPLGLLIDRLSGYDGGGSTPAEVYAPDRYWGRLVSVGDLSNVGAVAWPWPGIAPAGFAAAGEPGWMREGRRIMSAGEAAVLGLSNDGGVVQRIYLRGPAGKTVYAFSMWPMLPDEAL